MSNMSKKARTIILPEKLNFNLVLESFCMIIDLLYITFADNVYS